LNGPNPALIKRLHNQHRQPSGHSISPSDVHVVPPSTASCKRRETNSRTIANTVMATVYAYPPSETHTQTTAGLFSPMMPGYAGSSTRTYSESSHSAQTSPIKYNPLTLPPATDTLINTGQESQPSLTARLHRRKKTYQPPTAPPANASQPHDPLRAARLAWRLQEEYAEQLRVEEEQMRQMRQSSSSFQRQQREHIKQTAPAQSRRKQKNVRSKWQAFCLWMSLAFYRFTRKVKSVFK